MSRYDGSIEEPLSVGKKKGLVVGVGLGLTYGFIYGLFGAAFLLGVDLMIKDDGLSAGDILIVSDSPSVNATGQALVTN